MFDDLKPPKITSELREKIESVSAKRPKTILNHILNHGYITPSEIISLYGYNHPPRAIRDIREYGIPITIKRINGEDDRAISFYVLDTSKTVNNTTHYYTCFISYSTQDRLFAEKIHADLQSKGVNCWFAPEDLKIGEFFRQRIDESIRLYDKLLLILSEHSIGSTWVETEVEAAFEKERQQNKLVLFPIQLDETIMKATQAWAATIRRTRHMGDFRNWNQYEAYQKSLIRLLRDLQQDQQQTIL